MLPFVVAFKAVYHLFSNGMARRYSRGVVELQFLSLFSLIA